jgi:hypothetical protein
MKKLTKKQDGKRCMKKMPQWYGVNKSTPTNWYDRWQDFTDTLMTEIGFVRTKCGSIEKIPRKEWVQKMTYSHTVLGEYTIHFKRKRRQEGGCIYVACGDKEVMVDTISYIAYPVMCRTTVGDKILEVIRTNWESQNLESKPNEEG